MMESERKRSKGSFFNFFDWNGKSRKKLFLNNTELTEGPKLGPENVVESLAKSQLHAVEVDDTRENSSNKGCSDLSCASSVTSDEGYGRSRAPGVVARLMGLNSLPTSNVVEPSSTPFLNSSFAASQHDRSSFILWSDYNSMDYLNVSSNQEGHSSSSLESKSRKVQNRPIERFQAELLPPKSAKSVPVTHNKLLSPIRSPGFIPSKNAAYIMEAAAKIIEASPKANVNGKMASIRSSSVPLRIRDLKQKMETAHAASKPPRSNDLSAARNTKGQYCDRSPSGPEGISSRKASTFSENGASDGVKNKGKSTSLAIELRSNVQRREGATSRNGNIKKQKEQKEIKSNQSPKSLPSRIKNKRTENRNNNVLRQNNQEQNCSLGKENPKHQNSISNQAGRKTQTRNSSVGRSRASNRGVIKPEISRKMRLVVTDSVKAKQNNMPMKKQLVNDELQIGRSVSENASLKRDERSIKCNISVDGCLNTAVDNRKNSMDVVSFTFTSPVKKTTTNIQPSVVGKSNSFAFDLFGSNNYSYFSKSTSFPGLNVIGGDALGVLLEQKLRELSNKVESSRNEMVRDETSASSTSSVQDFKPICNVVSTAPAAKDRRSLLVQKEKQDHQDNFDYVSTECSRLNADLKWQMFRGSKEMEECSNSGNYGEAEKDQCQHSSPISILEPSFESASCSNTNVESDDARNGLSTNSNKYLEVEGETELSDSASSVPSLDVVRKHVAETSITPESREPTDWELDYVRDVINNAEQMFKDSRFDWNPKLLYPHLFHQLENQEIEMKRNEEEHRKLDRKILFDCINEWLEVMCGQTVVGSYKSWARTWTLFERKDWLAKELYEEIIGWRGMGDLMVDELVDKDMRSKHGRWLDFSMESLEETVEIENEILNSLLEEVVTDLFTL